MSIESLGTARRREMPNLRLNKTSAGRPDMAPTGADSALFASTKYEGSGGKSWAPGLALQHTVGAGFQCWARNIQASRQMTKVLRR
jgi:hypothetical protein